MGKWRSDFQAQRPRALQDVKIAVGGVMNGSAAASRHKGYSYTTRTVNYERSKSFYPFRGGTNAKLVRPRSYTLDLGAVLFLRVLC